FVARHCPGERGATLLESEQRFRQAMRRLIAHALMNASRSALTLSLRVEHMPCGAPGYIFSVEPLIILDESMAEAPIGTIWSSSPWRMSVGTSNFLRS